MPNNSKFFSIISLIISIIWIWFSINFLLSLLITISNLLNIPKIFLNLTILSYGTSISELILNLRLSKFGYKEMALSDSISGPLFNLLIGLGLSLTKLIIKKGKIRIDHSNNKFFISIFFLIFSLVNLASIGLQVKTSNFHLNVNLAFVRFTFYFLFVTIFCIILLSN